MKNQLAAQPSVLQSQDCVMTPSLLSSHDKYPRPAWLAHQGSAAKMPVWRRPCCLDLCVGLEMIHVSYYLQTIQLTS